MNSLVIFLFSFGFLETLLLIPLENYFATELIPIYLAITCMSLLIAVMISQSYDNYCMLRNWR